MIINLPTVYIYKYVQCIQFNNLNVHRVCVCMYSRNFMDFNANCEYTTLGGGQWH